MNLRTLKNKLRERIHVMLRAEQAQYHPQAPQMVRDYFLAHFKNLDSKLIVAGTMPIKEELDPWPLLRALAGKGHPLCLPIHGEKGTPLIFHAYKEGDALESGQWGINMPKATQPVCEPDIIISPLLAFDRAGCRLGYGGGYYDATFKALRNKKKIVAVGIGFAAQEVEQVPVGKLDQKLDLIITEKEVIVP